MLLVANPASRQGMRRRAPALRAFRKAGVGCDLLLTAGPGDAASAVRERAADYEAVFTLGGDGTAMEVIGALAGTGRPVGVLPAGTGNLLARTLGVPLGVSRAVPALLNGDRAWIDLGRLADGRRFAFAAGVGIDARMIEDTPARLKRHLGVLAYALSAGRALLRRDLFHARVTVDGRTYDGPAAAVMVANFGAILGDLIRLGPDIRQDDGLLDCCVFAPRTVGDVARVMWRLARKDFRPDPCLTYLPGRHIRVETHPPLRVQADGELVGRTPFEVHVDARAAQLLVPRTAPPAYSA